MSDRRSRRDTDVSDRSASDRKKNYHRILSVIDKQTGYGQPVLVSANTLWQVAVADGSMRHEASERALRATVENDHVIRWKDESGQIRYCLTPAGVEELPHAELPIYETADESKLRDALGTENQRPKPDQLVTEVLATHIQSLQDRMEGDDA